MNWHWRTMDAPGHDLHSIPMFLDTLWREDGPYHSNANKIMAETTTATGRAPAFRVRPTRWRHAGRVSRPLSVAQSRSKNCGDSSGTEIKMNWPVIRNTINANFPSQTNQGETDSVRALFLLCALPIGRDYPPIRTSWYYEV